MNRKIMQKKILPENLCAKNQEKTKSNECFYIYKSRGKFLYIDLKNLKIYKEAKGGEASELSFRKAIRYIDTIAEKTPNWKRKNILFLANKLGFFGIQK